MFRNTVAQSLVFVVQTLVSFLLAPIMLAQLGLTTYGVWTVIGSIVLYAGLLDVGVSRSLSRFVALYDARGDRLAVQQCVGLGMIAVTAAGCLLLPMAWFGAPLVHAAVGHISLHETRMVLLASATIFVVKGYTGVLVALPHGLQQMMAPNVAVSIGAVANFVVSVVTLLLTDSLAVYAWANAAIETVTIGIVLISVRRVWRHRLLAMPTRERWKEVLGYSVRVQAVFLAALVNLTTDRIVIGIVVGPAAAGAYALASSVAMGIRSVGVLTVSAMIPGTTAEIVKGARAAVRDLFRRYAPVSLGLSLPIFVLGGLSAPFLIEAWLGETTPHAIGILIALCVAYAANVATGVPSTLAMAEGRPELVSNNAIVMAALNLVLAVAFALLFGLWGVMAGTVIAMVLLSVVFVIQFARRYEVHARDVRSAFARPTLLSLALALPLVPIVVATAPLADSRWTAAALLIGVTVAYGLPYWILAGRMRLLPERLTLPHLRRLIPV